MSGVDAFFTPFYGSRLGLLLRELGLLESTIAGHKLRIRCLRYLNRHRLDVDLDGRAGGYDLVVNCTDVLLPSNLSRTPMVVVQEGMVDPPNWAWPLVRQFPQHAPRWLCGTTATGLSGKYERFCVASRGYRDLFIARGARPERVVATGIPNFDDFAAFQKNDFPRHGYVLVCTSDTRETFKSHDRDAFIRRACDIAGGRELIFKLHPNERVARARREIESLAPQATVLSEGPTEAMIANCAVLVTEWSSVAFAGLALGKEVHSSWPIGELRRLLPEQNRSAARRIAAVCQEVLAKVTGRSVSSQSAEVAA
ncbi:MAG TPA: hypothetical protein VER96_37535 [Polyangiaceae bacterium]|nr:hypothetical protein [Polyangiaceae bacterium]